MSITSTRTATTSTKKISTAKYERLVVHARELRDAAHEPTTIDEAHEVGALALYVAVLIAHEPARADAGAKHTT